MSFCLGFIERLKTSKITGQCIPIDIFSLQYNEKVLASNSPLKVKTRSELILERNAKGKPVVEVDPSLVKKLKPHQVYKVVDVHAFYISCMQPFQPEFTGVVRDVCKRKF